MVFLQGANILLTDKGDVKLGKIISHFHHLLSACCNITSCLKKQKNNPILSLFFPADFGVAAKITATIAKRKSFIGTPYW